MYTLQRTLYADKTQSYTWLNLIKEHNSCARTYGWTLFELIYHVTPIYAVDRQPLFCTFCARAQNVSKQSCHLGPSGPNGKIREKMIFQRGARYFIKGEVRVDTVQYLVQTQFGKLPKCPRIHIFPYLIKAVSPVDELTALCG